MEIRPIAHIRTDFKEKFGVPRQSGRVQSLTGRIIFEPEYRAPDALRGIEAFYHLWLIFDFSEDHREGWSATVRPPRLGGNERVGVFATRSPFRPNSLGLSSVKLEAVENGPDGPTLTVSGADLLDMTPIYDIKPYIPYTDCHPDASGGFAEDNRAHRLEVVFPDRLLSKLPPEKRRAAAGCIADDPRPSYQNDPGRVYGMLFAGFDIRFTVAGDTATVVSVEKPKEENNR